MAIADRETSKVCERWLLLLHECFQWSQHAEGCEPPNNLLSHKVMINWPEGMRMSLSTGHEDDDVKAVATEIEQYLRDRKHVADTIDGITDWWLLRQRLKEEKQKVKKAVLYLCEKGVIKKRMLLDGSILYTTNPEYETQGPE